MKKLLMLLCLGVSSHSVWANTLVEMQTNLGNIEIELYDDKAPMSVNNFKGYIKSGFIKRPSFTVSFRIYGSRWRNDCEHAGKDNTSTY